MNLHSDCTYTHCVERIKMLKWIDKTKPLDKSKENIEGIIKCNNPNCKMYFDFIEWRDSFEYQEA